MHYILGGQRSVRIAPPCLLITAVQQPGISSPLSWLKHSSKGVIWRETKGTPRCLWEGNDGEVRYSGACMGRDMGKPDIGRRWWCWTMAGDRNCWWRIKAWPAHLDDTLGGALHPKWRTRSPWLLRPPWCSQMRRQEGRGNPYQPLTSNDIYPQ